MHSRRAATFLAIALMFSACRTTLPKVSPFKPLEASTSEAAMEELRQRRASFSGERALVRIRATSANQTRSFKAQLFVRDDRYFELTAYTPVGTVAAKLVAEGDHVKVDQMGSGDWEGNVGELGGPFAIFSGALKPADLALLLTGLPADDPAVKYEVSPQGISRATAGSLTVTFDPPVFPPQKVVVEQGSDRFEIDFLQLGDPE